MVKILFQTFSSHNLTQEEQNKIQLAYNCHFNIQCVPEVEDILQLVYNCYVNI